MTTKIEETQEETKVQEEQAQSLKIKVRHCHHGEDSYSIGIEVKDVQMAMRAYSFSPSPGSHNDVTIFDMSIDDMLRLAQLIQDEAFKIKHEKPEEAKQ